MVIKSFIEGEVLKLRKPKIIFFGSVPPPYIGPNVATVIILNSGLKNKFDLIHLDTSDHRGLSTLGAILKNTY